MPGKSSLRLGPLLSVFGIGTVWTVGPWEFPMITTTQTNTRAVINRWGLDFINSPVCRTYNQRRINGGRRRENTLACRRNNPACIQGIVSYYIRLVDQKSGHLKSFINTASLVVVPRARTSRLPSGAHAKSYICSVLKSVNCFGGLSSKGKLQTFVTPPWVSRR